MPNPENIEDHKWEEGQSGNPKGRPKGSRNLSTILKEMLQQDVEVVGEDGEKKKLTFQDAIVKKLLTQANKGDIRAIIEIFDRTEGKAKQEIDQKTTLTDNRVDASKLTDQQLRQLDEIQRASGFSGS